ncbi:chloride channel protein [Andreprevotia chitinilytica]|uniref:chloride channel protein n=1 Tax=Andreprevotia chitinilytica TaxID=396808 RepID=UPI00146FEF12|nr:chloride channel protein [Andreprevotia chitinilytica]
MPHKTQATLALWVGAAGVGLIAVLLAKAAEWAFAGFALLQHRWWWWPFISLPLGGILIRWVMTRIGQGAEGSGIPQTMAALQVADDPGKTSKLIGARIAIAKFVGIVMGIGCGFVLGREGPTVQIGASLMYACRRFAPIADPAFRRQLILAGGAAGIAAAFNTPLAGIVFAFEELARSVEERTSGKLIGAVILSGVVSLAFLGNYTYFGRIHVPQFTYSILIPLLPISIAAGLIGGLFSWLCVHQTRWLPSTLLDWRIRHPYFFVAACGLLIALCGLGAPIFGSGAEATSHAVSTGEPLPWLFLPLKFIGLVATFLTGLPGGIFAPALSLGAGLGSWFVPLFGMELHVKLVAIGMTAMLAAVTRAPLTSAVIMIEMTDGHEMVISTLAAAMVASTVARVFKTRLYHEIAERSLAQFASPRLENSAPPDEPSDKKPEYQQP